MNKLIESIENFRTSQECSHSVTKAGNYSEGEIRKAVAYFKEKGLSVRRYKNTLHIEPKKP